MSRGRPSSGPRFRPHSQADPRRGNAVRRTFTLREFARLVSQVEEAEISLAAGPNARPAERLVALVPLASAHRQQVPAEQDNIVDPYRRSDSVYQESYSQIIAAVRVVARAALGVPSSTRR